MQKGSAQPHVYASDINGWDLLCPTDALLFEFEKIVLHYYDSIGCLNLQIKQLTEARDRLLPKLMSGEIAL
jgi:type I restriction enzyme S subunit